MQYPQAEGSCSPYIKSNSRSNLSTPFLDRHLAQAGIQDVLTRIQERFKRGPHLSWSKWIRQIHRWVSMAFTAGVIFNTIVVVRQKQPPFWVYLLALVPLGLLLLTGLYLFVLPYLTRRSSGERASASLN
jgi:hypothetical protein